MFLMQIACFPGESASFSVSLYTQGNRGERSTHCKQRGGTVPGEGERSEPEPQTYCTDAVEMWSLRECLLQFLFCTPRTHKNVHFGKQFNVFDYADHLKTKTLGC